MLIQVKTNVVSNKIAKKTVGSLASWLNLSYIFFTRQ